MSNEQGRKSKLDIEQRIYNRAVELRERAEGTPQGHPFKMTGAHRGYLEKAAREVTKETGHQFRLDEDEHHRARVVVEAADGGTRSAPLRGGQGVEEPKANPKEFRTKKSASRKAKR